MRATAMSACAWGVDCCGFDATGSARAAAPGTPLCGRCLSDAAAGITQLGRDYHRLGQELTPSTQRSRYRLAHGDPDRVPLALRVEELQRAIYWALTVWEPPVREAAGLPPEQTRAVRDAWAVKVAGGVLTHQIAVLAALRPIWGYAEGLDAGPVERSGLDALRSFQQLHRQARAILGAGDDPLTWLPGTCPECDATALTQRHGIDLVRCQVCKATMPLHNYRRRIQLVPTKG
jgi:hypothetical protein